MFNSVPPALSIWYLPRCQMANPRNVISLGAWNQVSRTWTHKALAVVWTFVTVTGQSATEVVSSNQDMWS